MTTRRFAGLALALALAAGCGTSGPPPTSPSPEPGPASYTLCPVGDLPPAGVNADATSVLEGRLRALGIEGASVTLGSCIDVDVPGVADDEALRGVLFATGLAEVLAVPPNRAGEIAAGQAPPDDLTLVFDSAGIAGASVTGDGLELQLDPAAASVLATWTTTHAGEALALVLDGRVVGNVPIDGRIDGDVLNLQVDAAAGLDPAAVSALLSAGPLPGDWRQPEVPQG